MALPAGRMHYVDEGHGEAVLFVHGTPTWSYEYRHLIRALAPTHRCIAPDHLGFGLSDRPAAFGYTPAEHAASLARFVEALGLDRFALVVHDFGGPIGLPLCLDDPERITALCLLNTWMWSLAGDPGLRRRGRLAGSVLGRLLYRVANFSPRVLLPYAYGDRRKLTREIHRQYLAPFPTHAARDRVLWTLARELLGSSAYYDALWARRTRLLGRPAAIVWGMRDPAFGPRHLARWQALFGADARVVPLDGAGHWPQEEAPDVVAGELAGLLGRVPSGRGP